MYMVVSGVGDACKADNSDFDRMCSLARRRMQGRHPSASTLHGHRKN